MIAAVPTGDNKKSRYLKERVVPSQNLPVRLSDRQESDAQKLSRFKRAERAKHRGKTCEVFSAADISLDVPLADNSLEYVLPKHSVI